MDMGNGGEDDMNDMDGMDDMPKVYCFARSSKSKAMCMDMAMKIKDQMKEDKEDDMGRTRPTMTTTPAGNGNN